MSTISVNILIFHLHFVANKASWSQMDLLNGFYAAHVQIKRDNQTLTQQHIRGVFSHNRLVSIFAHLRVIISSSFLYTAEKFWENAMKSCCFLYHALKRIFYFTGGILPRSGQRLLYAVLHISNLYPWMCMDASPE